MNVALRKPMTLEQFLAWEERQPLRYEFDGFRPVAITGRTAGHAVIERNLIIALGTRLRSQPCQAYDSELEIQTAGHIRYPNAFVVCSPVASRATLVADPVVVFEVLSESTSSNDLVVKYRIPDGTVATIDRCSRLPAGEISSLNSADPAAMASTLYPMPRVD